jgi:hypothetical protein
MATSRSLLLQEVLSKAGAIDVSQSVLQLEVPSDRQVRMLSADRSCYRKHTARQAR